MNKDKTGLILGGLVLATGGTVGGYFLYKRMKGGVGRIGAPIYYGDWNIGQIEAYQRQQGMLFQQRQGIPQVF